MTGISPNTRIFLWQWLCIFNITGSTSFSRFPQKFVFHQSDRRRSQIPSQPHSRPHPESDRLLPDEHPRAAALYLLVSSWREPTQLAGPTGRRLWAVYTWTKGIMLLNLGKE